MVTDEIAGTEFDQEAEFAKLPAAVREVVELFGRGKPPKEIALERKVSVSCVYHQLAEAGERLHCADLSKLIIWAARRRPTDDLRAGCSVEPRDEQ